MPLPWFIVVLLNAHPFSPSPSLELVERLDGLAGAGQDTEDVEADLQDVRVAPPMLKYTSASTSEQRPAHAYRW